MSFLKMPGFYPKDSDLTGLELTNQDLPTISYVKKKKEKTHCHYINDTQYLPSSKSSLYFMWVLNSGAQQRSFNETAVPGPNST